MTTQEAVPLPEPDLWIAESSMHHGMYGAFRKEAAMNQNFHYAKCDTFENAYTADTLRTCITEAEARGYERGLAAANGFEAGMVGVSDPPAAVEALSDGVVSRYTYAALGVVIERVAQRRDEPDKWAIRDQFRHVMNKAGQWEDEPMPSYRDDEFMARARFETLDEARAILYVHFYGPKGTT